MSRKTKGETLLGRYGRGPSGDDAPLGPLGGRVEPPKHGFELQKQGLSVSC